MTDAVNPASESGELRGGLTIGEIRQQPELWSTTVERAVASGMESLIGMRAAVISGAGSSAYAAAAVAEAWPRAMAIPTTDLLVCSKRELAQMAPAFTEDGVLVSVARSGDSPESMGVVARIQRMFPDVMQIAITCNEWGQLAHKNGVRALVLDPRTNDRSLAMTSSFTNLVLAGLALFHRDVFAQHSPGIAARVRAALPGLEMVAQRLAARASSRLMVLTPADLTPLGREACLKALEMTGGRVAVLGETFLGVRHGPMSFLRPDTLVLCVLSSDTERRRYEEDVLRELRQKKLGHLVVVGENELGHDVIPAMAPELPDYLRTPFESVFPQLLAFHLSMAAGLDPDNPSPEGVITRVVQRFQLHVEGDVG